MMGSPTARRSLAGQSWSQLAGCGQKSVGWGVVDEALEGNAAIATGFRVSGVGCGAGCSVHLVVDEALEGNAAIAVGPRLARSVAGKRCRLLVTDRYASYRYFSCSTRSRNTVPPAPETRVTSRYASVLLAPSRDLPLLRIVTPHIAVSIRISLERGGSQRAPRYSLPT